MKTAIRFSFSALLILGASFAYPQSSRNAVYVEIGGGAVVPSVNYERRVNENWYGRAGVSIVQGGNTGGSATTFVIPLTASWVSRPGSNHHLEVGGGVTLLTGDRQDLSGVAEEGDLSNAVVTGLLGYRYQKPGGGFQFRAVFTPLVGGGVSAPWAGVSFGYAW